MTHLMKRRFSPASKIQIVLFIEWCGKNGFAEASKTIMTRLTLSHEELTTWRDKYKDKIMAFYEKIDNAQPNEN